MLQVGLLGRELLAEALGQRKDATVRGVTTAILSARSIELFKPPRRPGQRCGSHGLALLVR